LVATVSVAAEIKVATLNCFSFFDPRIEHRGKVDDDSRMTSARGWQKLTNLATLPRCSDTRVPLEQ
jgi:hypothetical protein